MPTQVVSEYLRRVFRNADGRPIQALAFDSAQISGGRNIVLFAEPSECVEREEAAPAWSNMVVELVEVRHHPLQER